MLRDLIDQFNGKTVVISSAPGNGVTSFTLYSLNTILSNDKLCIYYNPSADTDRKFIEKYYPRMAKDTIYMSGPLDYFLEFMQLGLPEFDCVAIDPGDVLMIDKDILSSLAKAKNKDTTLLITSQIRQDPNKAWAPYSTIETLGWFDYSVWITNVTGENPLFKQRYVDVFTTKRSGRNFILRDIAHFAEEGNIVEVR